MMDFKLVTKNLLETYLGSDTLNKVAIQDFLDANSSIIGTGKQEFFKNMDHFLSAFKFVSTHLTTLGIFQASSRGILVH